MNRVEREGRPPFPSFPPRSIPAHYARASFPPDMSIPDIEIDDERVNRRIERKSSSEIEEKANPSRDLIDLYIPNAVHEIRY